YSEARSEITPTTHDDGAVPSMSLVIFAMHMLGTAPSSWVVGVISERASLYTAMWVPTGALVVAAICMLIATRTFAHDRAAARTRGSGPRAGSAALELL